jgi:Ca2+-binding RTX toxin-like protein
MRRKKGDKLATFTGTAGNDYADATIGTLTGFTGGSVGQLQDATGDAFAGLASDDIIVAGSGDDTIDGGDDNDLLYGGTGNDTIDGGAGIDIGYFDFSDRIASVVFLADSDGGTYTPLVGGVASGSIRNVEAIGVTGGSGDDRLGGVYTASWTGLVQMFGGAGSDVLVIDASALSDRFAGGLNGWIDDVTTGAGLYNQEFEVLEFTGNASGINGGSGNDSLTGLSGDDIFAGNGGDDSISGGAGSDQLHGGTGNDTIDGGADADAMAGGGGNDIYIVDNTSDGVNEDPNDGIDTVQSSVSHTLNGNMENLLLTGGSAINGTGNGGANSITGNSANNVLAGLGGGDALDGGLGMDTASYAMSPAGVTVNLASGITSGGDAQGDTLFSIENLTGSAFADILTGNTGNNRIMGGGGSDILSGGAGADMLTSGAGNDSLTGGIGADQLTGGLGADQYIFVSVADFSMGVLDRIMDFNRMQGDRINLAVIDANSALAGNQAFTFIGAGAFTGVAGQLGYTPIAGGVRVRGDINGDGSADFNFTVLGVAALVGTDFVL